MILPLLFALALVAIATGIRIGHLLSDRRHQADLIHQAAAIRGSIADGRVRKVARW